MQVILYHSMESKLQQNFKLMWAELTSLLVVLKKRCYEYAFKHFFFCYFFKHCFTLNELSFGH